MCGLTLQKNVSKEKTQTNAETPLAVTEGSSRSSQTVRYRDTELTDVIRERRRQGESYGEIAEDLGISKSTAYRYAKDVKPPVITNVERNSQGASVFMPQKPNMDADAQVPGGVYFDQQALQNIRKMLTPKQLGIFESQIGVSSQRQEMRTNSSCQNLGSSALRNTMSRAMAARLAGIEDAEYMRGFGIDPQQFFGGANKNDGSSTSQLLKEMREYSLTLNLLQRTGSSANDPFIGQLKQELKTLEERYERVREGQHKAEIEHWKERVEQAKKERSDIEKIQKLLELDPDLKPYIMRKLGIKDEGGLVESLQKLGIDFKTVFAYAREFFDGLKGRIAPKAPPPPQTMQMELSPSEAELAEKVLPPEVLLEPSSIPNISPRNQSGTFADFSESPAPPTNSHLPSEETKTEEPEKRARGRAGSTRELSGGKKRGS